MKKGFTLIEMAVVLLIIGILAGIVLRNIGGQHIQARDAKRIADLKILTNYLAQYMAKQGQFPNTPDTSNAWSNLGSALSSAGIVVNLPKPSIGEPYVYYPCNDSGSTGIVNHFILRARLEQSITEAPRIYEGTYDSASAPSGWVCSAPAGFSLNCQASQKYYCLTQ
jgi:general secretion pathway protein G